MHYEEFDLPVDMGYVLKCGTWTGCKRGRKEAIWKQVYICVLSQTKILALWAPV